MANFIRNLKTKHRFTGTVVAAGIGVKPAVIYERMRGSAAWTAPEVVRFYEYLVSNDVDVDLGELTRMCAADHKGGTNE